MNHHVKQIAAIVLCVINIASSDECKPDKIFPMKDTDQVRLYSSTWRVQSCTPASMCEQLRCYQFANIPESDTKFGTYATAFNKSNGRDVFYVGIGTLTGPGEVYLNFQTEYSATKYYTLATDYKNYFLLFTWRPDIFGNVVRAAWLHGKTNKPLPFVRGAIEERLKMNNLEWDDFTLSDNEGCPKIV